MSASTPSGKKTFELIKLTTIHDDAEDANSA